MEHQREDEAHGRGERRDEPERRERPRADRSLGRECVDDRDGDDRRPSAVYLTNRANQDGGELLPLTAG